MNDFGGAAHFWLEHFSHVNNVPLTLYLSTFLRLYFTLPRIIGRLRWPLKSNIKIRMLKVLRRWWWCRQSRVEWWLILKRITASPKWSSHHLKRGPHYSDLFWTIYFPFVTNGLLASFAWWWLLAVDIDAGTTIILPFITLIRIFNTGPTVGKELFQDEKPKLFFKRPKTQVRQNRK